MNPKFDLMFPEELKAYLLAYRDDLKALGALVNRRSPDSEATWYPAPLTEETIRIFEEAIQRRIEADDRPSQNFLSQSFLSQDINIISGATDAGDVDLDPEGSGSKNVEVPAASVQGRPRRRAMYGKMGIDPRDSSKG